VETITKTITKLLSTFECFDYGLSKIELLEYWLERDKSITKDDIKDALTSTLADEYFDWVKLALETKFVYNVNDTSVDNFNIDDLLIFTDSFRWSDVVHQDAILSFNQKNELKDQFRELNIREYDSIHALLKHEDFIWLPFEVRHTYLKHFGKLEYKNQDIIYYLKIIVWDYLFPKESDKVRLSNLKESVNTIFESVLENQGWVEMDEIFESLKSKYTDLDLFELSKINWDINVQHKQHFRNPFTLGFKRIETLPR
jgi:hypothetical protein